jgi:FHS family L-fucose permease-like MFS transporter
VAATGLAAGAGEGTRADGHVDAPDLRLFVFALFFLFGGITSLNDVLIPRLKDQFALGYAEAMLVQTAFFLAYLLVSLPAARVVQKFGYMATAAFGLVTMAAGCLLFWPAAAAHAFPAFLAALFVLAAGITTVQVVANPLISLLGPARTAHSRLTFAQAFNSLGTTIFPYVGTLLILEGLAGDANAVPHTYMGLALFLLLLAGLVWARRGRLPHAVPDALPPVAQSFDLLRQTRFGWGALCIFLYVGAEVAIGSVIVSWLMEADVMELGEGQAGRLISVYWGCAMVGRFLGAGLLRLVSPGKVLAGAATLALMLLAAAGLLQGPVAGWALLLVGLANSIMFPTIFTLASEDLGARHAEGSGLICVAIVGGAVVPPLAGLVADQGGLRLAFWVPAACYAVILGFGLAAAGWAARRRLAGAVS